MGEPEDEVKACRHTLARLSSYHNTNIHVERYLEVDVCRGGAGLTYQSDGATAIKANAPSYRT